MRKLADINSSEIFFNKGEVLSYNQICVRYSLSKEIIRFYIGAPDSFLTSICFRDLYSFLDYSPNHTAKILIDKPEKMDSKVLNKLKETATNCNEDTNKGNILIKYINKNKEEKAKSNMVQQIGEGEYNFILFDSNQIRFEYDPVNLGSFGSFNREEECKVLIQLFDSIFDSI